MTKLEAVSKVQTLLKGITKDTRIPKRAILAELLTVTTQFISQRLGERSINNETNLYTSFNCIEFEKIEVVKCPIIEFRRCNILMRSVKPLPELLFSRLGSSLKNVTTIDLMNQVIVGDINQYRRNKKRKYVIDDEVFVFLGNDNHLYIPDFEIYGLSAEGITLNTEDVLDCSNKDSVCKSAWDSKFICPNKLEDYVFRQTAQTIAATYGAIIQDSNPNGIEKRQTE